MVLYPSAWLRSTGELGHWEGLLAARALDGQCYTVGANQARDEQQETVFYGRSVFYGPLGQVRKTPSWPRSWANCSLL